MSKSFNRPDEGSGPGEINPEMMRRTMLRRQAVQFFERMTRPSELGWSDISGEDFLMGLAQAIHSWLLARPEGWTLRTQLLQQLKENCERPRVIRKSVLMVSQQVSNKANHPLPEIDYLAMVKEFDRFLLSIHKDDTGATHEVQGSQMIRMLTDSVVDYGCKRNNGIAYLRTLQCNLLDLV